MDRWVQTWRQEGKVDSPKENQNPEIENKSEVMVKVASSPEKDQQPPLPESASLKQVLGRRERQGDLEHGRERTMEEVTQGEEVEIRVGLKMGQFPERVLIIVNAVPAHTKGVVAVRSNECAYEPLSPSELSGERLKERMKGVGLEQIKEAQTDQVMKGRIVLQSHNPVEASMLNAAAIGVRQPHKVSHPKATSDVREQDVAVGDGDRKKDPIMEDKEVSPKIAASPQPAGKMEELLPLALPTPPPKEREVRAETPFLPMISPQICQNDGTWLIERFYKGAWNPWGRLEVGHKSDNDSNEVQRCIKVSYWPFDGKRGRAASAYNMQLISRSVLRLLWSVTHPTISKVLQVALLQAVEEEPWDPGGRGAALCLISSIQCNQWGLGGHYLTVCLRGSLYFKVWDPGGKCFDLHLEDKVKVWGGVLMRHVYYSCHN